MPSEWTSLPGSHGSPGRRRRTRCGSTSPAAPNFDPATDEHIHATRLVIVDADKIESSWTGYRDGKEAGVRTFDLERGQ